jgi:hypothetical protein
MASVHNPQFGPSLVGGDAKTPDTGKPVEQKPDEQPARRKPSKVLPSERISFSKQLDILRAYVAASQGGNKACSLTEVSDVVRFNPNTVSMANPFFASTGLVQRTDGGFMPNADVIAFQRAYDWDAEKAALKLAPTLREQWFYQALVPHLAFGAIDEDKAIALLAEASAASPEYKSNLRLVLSYLVASGLIVQDGTLIKMVKSTQQQNNQAQSKPAEAPQPSMEQPAPQPIAPTVASSAPSSSTASGRIQINVSIDLDMTQLAGWQPDRIAALFAGMAQVIAAKGSDK